MKNCSVHENQDVEAHGSLKQALAAVFQNIEFLHKNLLRTPITLDLGIGHGIGGAQPAHEKASSQTAAAHALLAAHCRGMA